MVLHSAVIEWVRTAERINLLDIARLEFMSALQRRLRNQELTQADFRFPSAAGRFSGEVVGVQYSAFEPEGRR